MFIIVGLGNPGRAYENTYHNLGFMAIDKFAERIGTSFKKEKYKASIAEGVFCGHKVLLAKPLTFMNNSGESVALLKKQFADARIIVLVDDIDLPDGTIRYRQRGSSGTHNGLRSIVAYIGQDFERIKIGTGRDESKDLADFVLSKITDKALFDKATDEACDVLEKLIKEDNL